MFPLKRFQNPTALRASQVCDAVEQVTAEEHLLDEGSFRPGNSQKDDDAVQYVALTDR